MPPDQDMDTIRKLSQQTDNLLAVVSLLQSQFEAVKKDVQAIKTNVAKLGSLGEEREHGESRKLILHTKVPHVAKTEADTSRADPVTDPTPRNHTQQMVVHPADWGVEHSLQRETQPGTQLVESGLPKPPAYRFGDLKLRGFVKEGSPFIFGASYDQEDTSDRKTSSGMDGVFSFKQQNSVVQSQGQSFGSINKSGHLGMGKKSMKQELNTEPTSRQESATHTNSTTSKFKTENVFDELINLKNEFQEWKIASAFVPVEMRQGMRNLASAHKEQEQKVDELRRFLNLQTQSFVDQQKLILDEMKSLSQKQISLSDDFRRLGQEELLDEMYQQHEDICEIMTFVGKQIKDLKVRVKGQCSWRCDTCMATSPMGRDHSQKLHLGNTVSHIVASSADGRKNEEHDPVIGLPESVDLTTGDEGEEVVFKERAKLYRYDSDTKAWKKCGGGDIKIMKDPETGRAKLVMITDKVHKVCAYHWLTSDMDLLPGRSPDHTWVWRAVDFREGNVSQEQFAIKFENPELAAKFKNNFDKMKIQWKGNSPEIAKSVKMNSAEQVFGRPAGHRFDALNSVKSINSSGSYGLRKKIGYGQGEVDFEDVLDDIDSGSEEYQPEREEKGGSSHQRKCSVHEEPSVTAPAFGIPKSTITPSTATRAITTLVVSPLPTTLKKDTTSVIPLIKPQTSGTQSLTSKPASTRSPAASVTHSQIPSALPKDTSTTSTSGCLASFFNSLQNSKTVTPATTNSKQSTLTGFSFSPAKNGTPSLFGSPVSSVFMSTTSASESLTSKFALSKPKVTTQTSFVGFSFNKNTNTSSSSVSSHAFQFPKSVAPITMNSSPLPFAQPIFQTTPAKKSTSSLFRSQVSPVIKSKTSESHSPVAGFSCSNTTSNSINFGSSLGFQIPESTVSATPTSSSLFSGGFSFSTTPVKKDTSSLFSSPDRPIIKSTTTTPESVSSHLSSSKTMVTSASPFAGFSFQTTASKKDINALFGSSVTSQSCKDNSAAQQHPQLTTLQSASSTQSREEETGDPLRPGLNSPTQSFDDSRQKQNQSAMGVSSTSPHQQEEKQLTAPLKDNDDGDDVIFIGKCKVTPEQVAQAEKLMLPADFYLYEQRPPCPGCRGCNEEDMKARKEGDKPVALDQKSSFLLVKAKGLDTSTGKPFQFASAGPPVCGSTQQEDDRVAEDQDYDPHYDPVIILPMNVDLTTGDEGEEVVFKERAKLYRYDSDTKAWKERGVGDMKILRNPETGRARILMRRDQVLKVCANHWLAPDMELLPMTSSDCAWVWRAIDFAEEEDCHEQFAIKFKTPSLAAAFKETFDKMKEEGRPNLEKSLEPMEEKPEEKPEATVEDDSEERFQPVDPVVEDPDWAKEETNKGEEESPVSPEEIKDATVKEKESTSPSKTDKNKKDEQPLKPSNEEEEEKEVDTSREVKFSAPAELFNEDENKDWAPRGKGQFQILFDKENKNYQVEMKRDKDNSLCAKHCVTKSIQLVPVRGMDRSFAWSAMDSSDKAGSPVSMVFAVRFKNRETAYDFQDEFQKAQTEVVKGEG